ncbi:hypothetical protein [Streptacidiphilus sp. P02-A3a]|uniref:hypothetical protein n=1 Tax=Streptacidiphilus sp. P02-A3a TaxID=2704468 RepID=UPI0015FB6DC5|nr:hypothetical protein [Streptacidiphilus sp. P02-A3a]QMU66812.1 hypothetical protein GXP74_11715 [Streptacidiphilus sp. P02-A3a]
MCQRTTCRTCGKAGFRGCGQHVEQVLAGVPAAQRCACAARRAAAPAEAAAPGGNRGQRRFLGLFGRR